MSKKRPAFSWLVYVHDFNSDKIKPYDVLAGREHSIKKLRVQAGNEPGAKEAFAKELFADFFWQYWSRCEYELTFKVENERVILYSWMPPHTAALDVTDSDILDWPAFAEFSMKNHNNICYEGFWKFDVHDQLLFRHDELVDFCWNYPYRYLRRSKCSASDT